MIKTGRIVYPYFRAYLMNPFRCFMNILISRVEVSVAYSYPPGTRDMVLPSDINFFMVSASTDYIPHNRIISPTMGILSINLLLRDIVEDTFEP